MQFRLDQENTTVHLIIHVFCKSYEPQIVLTVRPVLQIKLKQKQFHVRKSHKTHKSTLSYVGNFEENIDLSHIHLAVPFNIQEISR